MGSGLGGFAKLGWSAEGMVCRGSGPDVGDVLTTCPVTNVWASGLAAGTWYRKLAS